MRVIRRQREKKKEIEELRTAAQNGVAINEETALVILTSEVDDIPQILACTNALRLKYFGKKVHLCSIVNAKSGSCEQDCAFCAQSVHHQTEAKTYSMISSGRIKEAFNNAARLPVDHFGVVTSGGALEETCVEEVADVLQSEKSDSVHWCVSLGLLSTDQLLNLKKSGLKRFHHNLETAQSFFPTICSTHSYDERLEMVRRVKEAGLQICSGGILGLGETLLQRVELAATLKRERVDSIPLNFLVPVSGTPLQQREVMKPLDIIRCIAMFRMMNPEAELKVCAGRTHLRDLQSQIFYAGATGMMIGPLLTVAGRDVDEDLQMLRDLEIEFEL